MIDEGMVIDFGQWLERRIRWIRAAKAEYHKIGDNDNYFKAVEQEAVLMAVWSKFEEATGWTTK